MSAVDRLKGCLRWDIFLGAAGLVVGVVSVVITIYSFQGRAPHLVFEIQAESNVLDVHKPLPELAITFQGEDLRATRKNLRLVTVAIRNDGRAPLLQNLYDQLSPWGIHVTNGVLINQPRIAGTNSEYLRTNLAPSIHGDSTLEFQKVIIEPKDYVAIELLILHASDQEPDFVAFGKIAGVGTLDVTRSPPTVVRPSFLERLFDPPWWMHILRLGLYVAIFLVFLSILALFQAFIASPIVRASEKKVMVESRDCVDAYLRPLVELRPETEAKLLRRLFLITAGDKETIARYCGIVDSQEVVAGISSVQKILKSLQGRASFDSAIHFSLDFPRFLFKQEEDGSLVPIQLVRDLLGLLARHVEMIPPPDTTRSACKKLRGNRRIWSGELDVLTN